MSEETTTKYQETVRPEGHPLAFLESKRKQANITRAEMVKALGGGHTRNTVWYTERHPENVSLARLEHYVATLRKLGAE